LPHNGPLPGNSNIVVANLLNSDRPVRVLYSFPHRLGMSRICATAWHEIDSATAAGAQIHVIAGDCVRPFSRSITVDKTFVWGRVKLPYRLLGTRRMCILHDKLVALKLPRLRDNIDVIHAWPLAALETFRVAKSLGIPTVLERPNAHTRFAYEAVRAECERLGISMPDGHEHAFDAAVLAREEAEYALASRLLCPSDFVARTFREKGFSTNRIARHQYGCDETLFHPEPGPRPVDRPFTVLFAGGCSPRKGLHFALEAWLRSRAHQNGVFLIVGDFIPAYRDRISSMLSHPSVQVLGYRKDIAEIMRRCDVFTLPSIEEGSALVTYEARASGCLLLVSEASGAICQHGVNSLVHPVGDVNVLRAHFDMLYERPDLLQSFRTRSLETLSDITWKAGGRRLFDVYRSACGLPDL
jgi:glycosyltransferase involved in cell wall biosynthesis